METLSSLRRQMNSARDLQSIVKSMKALSAATIWQFEQAVTSLNEYRRTVEMGLQIVLSTRPADIQIAQPELQKPLGAIIFGSERGMVGNFNDQIVRYALRRMQSMHVPRADRSLVTVGRRLHNNLKRADQPVALTLPMPTGMAGVRPAVQELMVRLDAWRAQVDIERIMLFHNAPTTGTQYQPQAVQLIPVNVKWLQGLQRKPWLSSSLPTYDAHWEALFSNLIQEHLYAAVFRAFVASASAENASRLSAMEEAERNIEEQLNQLKQQYHQVRQRSITSELLDIVAGAEATTEASENGGSHA